MDDFIIDMKRGIRVNLPIIDQKMKKWQRLGIRMLTTQIQILPISFLINLNIHISSYVSSPTKPVFLQYF